MVRGGLTCREVVELATDYFEAGLPAAASKRFAAHVAHCEGCQAYLRQLRITVDIVHTVAGHERIDMTDLLSDFPEVARRRGRGRRFAVNRVAPSADGARVDQRLR